MNIVQMVSYEIFSLNADTILEIHQVFSFDILNMC